MSIERLKNAMRYEGQRNSSTKSLVRRGVVSGYDPSSYCAKVRMQPEDFETGFLPVASAWVGPGWGLFCPPSPGDEVDVHFQEGGKNAAYISLRFFGNVARPLPVSPGECWLVHQSGSFLKLTNDGKASVNGEVEIDLSAPTVNITATAAVNVTAPSITLGSAGETLHKLVTDAFETLFNTHTHPGIQPGGGNTGAPNELITNSQLTSVVSAG